MSNIICSYSSTATEAKEMAITYLPYVDTPDLTCIPEEHKDGWDCENEDCPGWVTPGKTGCCEECLSYKYCARCLEDHSLLDSNNLWKRMICPECLEDLGDIRKDIH